MQEQTHLPEPSSIEPIRSSANGNDDLPDDALVHAAATIVADLKHEWAREMELMRAQAREIVAKTGLEAGIGFGTRSEAEQQEEIQDDENN